MGLFGLINRFKEQQENYETYGIMRSAILEKALEQGKAKNYTYAISLLVECAWWDLSGMSSYRDKEPLPIREYFKYFGGQFFPYSKTGASSICIAPAIVDKMRTYKNKAGLSDDDFLEIVSETIDKMSSPFHVFTKVECIEIILYEVMVRRDLLQLIYDEAEERLKRQFPGIKFRGTRNVWDQESLDLSELHDAHDRYKYDHDLDNLIDNYKKVLYKKTEWDKFDQQMQLIKYLEKQERYNEEWSLLQKMYLESLNYSDFHKRHELISYKQYGMLKKEKRYYDALASLITHHVLKSKMYEGKEFDVNAFLSDALIITKHTKINNDLLNELIWEICNAKKDINIQSTCSKIYSNFLKNNNIITR